MRPKIGYHYILEIDKDLYGEPITWAIGKRVAKYSTFGEIDGKIVKVNSISRIMAFYCLVSLNEIPRNKFYVSSKVLKEIKHTPSAAKCTCELHLLCNMGCQCGAIEEERSSH